MRDKEVNRSYTLKTEIIWDEKQDTFVRHIERKNDGFSPYELLGILEEAQQDILDQIRGLVKADIIKREVVVDEPPEGQNV